MALITKSADNTPEFEEWRFRNEFQLGTMIVSDLPPNSHRISPDQYVHALNHDVVPYVIDHSIAFGSDSDDVFKKIINLLDIDDEKKNVLLNHSRHVVKPYISFTVLISRDGTGIGSGHYCYFDPENNVKHSGNVFFKFYACEHEYERSNIIRQCLTEYQCKKCGSSITVDSSD